MTDYADICHRWHELAKVAAGITPTELPLDPSPNEILALRDDLEILINAVDPLIEAYGKYLDANVSGHTDQPMFRDQLRGALEGNAFFEIESEAEGLEMDLMEAVR